MFDLDFKKHDYLLPVVLQDADNDAVLMVGFMNREALAKTIETGCATFLSRTRQRLWTKGETSGSFAVVDSITTDCDRDALLLRVRVRGDGNICHNRTRSCFTEVLEVPVLEPTAARP